MHYSYIKERVKHAVRFRHKRGFGVHSPFVFNLITRVIRDRKGKFVYPEHAENAMHISRRSRKFYRLLYRLITHLGVKRVLCIGEVPEALRLYLPVDVVIHDNMYGEADLIYVGKEVKVLADEWWTDRISRLDGKKICMVIAGIHLQKGNMNLWQLMKNKARVSIDMMWYGLLFLDEKLQEGRYNLIL
ncbi:hypothetical protein LJB85_02750 [Porphyromonadaceae bacterium OttesenSCG-928-L07]|nr:hypothetical protein [Porphyromonadaceae bacterium OttesenSCG-928-L07]MDL2251941.1 hypothetical protein [Odoribacter sp. OttesenSCG-928-J03]